MKTWKLLTGWTVSYTHLDVYKRQEQQLNEEMLSENRSLHYLVTSLIYDNIQNQKQLELLLDKYEIDPAQEYAALSIKMPDTTLEPALRFYFAALGCRLSLYLYPNEWVVIFDRETFGRFSPSEFGSRFQERVHSGMGPFCTPVSYTHLSGSFRTALPLLKAEKRPARAT